LKNRNTAILAVAASGRLDRFSDAVGTTASHHRRDACVPTPAFQQVGRQTGRWKLNAAALTSAIIGVLAASSGVALAREKAAPTAAQPPASPALRSTMEQEILRRQQRVHEATGLIYEGDKLAEDKDLAGALDKYRKAMDLLPRAEMTAKLRQMAAQRYADTAVRHAEALAKNGGFAEARQLLENVLSPDYFPEHPGAQTLLKRLDDSDYFNPAVTPAHSANVQKVRKLLQIAQGHVDLGNFDEAVAAYNQILAIDPHNSAARRGMEQCERFKVDYLRSARDHTRTKMLTEVDQNWESAVPLPIFAPKTPEGAAELSAGASSGKLQSIIFPRLSMEGATLPEVVQYIMAQSRELDSGEPDPNKKGINIILSLGKKPLEQLPVVNLSDMRNVPLQAALNWVTEQTDTRWRLQNGQVIITPASAGEGQLIQRSYSVPPGFLANAPLNEGAGKEDDPFAAPAAGAEGGGIKTKLQVSKVTAKQFLETSGVDFPEGTYAEYNRAANQLVVRNTEKNHAIVEALVDQLRKSTTKQARVTVRILQASESHLTELGFDWLLGAFGVAGSGRVFGSGGTYGNAGSASAASLDFPFILPSSSAAPGSEVPIGQFPMTGGLRSTGALRQNITIDDVLTRDGSRPPGSLRSPGAFAVGGVFTDPQFQAVMRALDQKKGLDLSLSSTVVMRSGQIARASSTREIYVPTDYDPPQIPQTAQTGNIPPVTPTTPTSFEKRDTGSLIEVEATISEDGHILDLVLAPQFTEFEGFINYGTPISILAAGDTPTEVTRNWIGQPVFRHIRSEKVSLSLYDGATIAFGGLSEMKNTKIEDKVPFFGDLPIVGRLFRSTVDETSRRAIVFFVTADVIDGAGRKLRDSKVDDPSRLETPGE
jgi:general secretion pathway protein D